jgi:hypothetical protein
VDGKVKWDGDEYLPSGKVKRRLAIKTFNGSETGWTAYTVDSVQWFFCNGLDGLRQNYVAAEDKKGISSRYDMTGTIGASPELQYTVFSGDKIAVVQINSFNRIWIKDTSYSTLADFKTSLSTNPIVVVYELAIPTEEEAEPFTEVQIVDNWGTEEFISDSIVPVGHETRYPANLRDKLQHLPDLASGDGNYMIQQNGSQMTLVPSKVPQAPTANGTYVLKVTVSGGTPTYKWEAAT